MQQPTEADPVVGDMSEQTAVLVERAQATRRPVSLTAAGDEVAVLLDARDFRAMEERLALLQDILRAEAEVAEGHVISHEEAKARVRAVLDE